MPIEATDVKYYQSDHSAGGIDSIGGDIDSDELSSTAMNNIFDDVPGSESLPGDTEYRVVFVKNEHGSLTWTAVKAYLENNENNQISIGTKVAKNTAAQDLTDEDTDPTGVTWNQGADYDNGISLPDLAPNDYVAIFLRRVVPANDAADDAKNFRLNVDGDTAQ